MFAHKHVRITVALTMLAILLAAFSFALPWYLVKEVWVDDELRTHYHTYEFRYSYFQEDYEVRRYDPFDSGVGSLLDGMAALVCLWALLSIAYAAAIIPCGDRRTVSRWDGFLMGWILVAFILVIILGFVVLVTERFNTYHSLWHIDPIDSFADRDGLSYWGPMIGWWTLLLAGVIQTIAVLVRNVPMLLNRSQNVEELSSVEKRP